jgi:leucyl-tRNA synthetase
MEILPEEIRAEFNNVIDWLHEKACARKSGMGTRLPWDPEWIIESLSDSVIYMAYYTIVKHIRKFNVKPEQLTNSAFDYIFLGIGNSSEIAQQTGLKTDILEKMRSEFTYFYPLDSRHSGRDLVPNHLTFMIFNHTAIFPEKLWPRQIATNGSVLMHGAKMSKSFGNIIPLREGLTKFGADPLRLGVLATAELLQDADFSPTVAKAMRDRLERLYRFAAETFKNEQKGQRGKKASLAQTDKWMLSRLQMHIKAATQAMDKLAVRKAIHSALYGLDQDFQWYLRRTKDQQKTPARKNAINSVIREILEAQIKMLAPVTPHICEELWEMMGGKGFISLASWPTPDSVMVDVAAEENEALIMGTLEDTLNIVKATSIKPKKICYYVAAPWKWQVYTKIIEKAKATKPVQAELMKELMKNPELRKRGEQVAKFVSQTIEEVNKLSEERKERLLQAGIIKENERLEEAKSFLKRELKAEIHVYSEEDSKRFDPKKRANLAKPHRPAIYIE